IAQMKNNEKAYKALLQIGPPPWNNLKHNRIHQKYVEALGGGITRDGTMVRKIMLNLITSKEYTLRDFIRFLQGQFFDMKITFCLNALFQFVKYAGKIPM
ncbi:hypothetical protein AB6N22_12720, partial [Kocuria palustris]